VVDWAKEKQREAAKVSTPANEPASSK